MSSKKLPYLIYTAMTTLVVGSAFTTFASDRNIPKGSDQNIPQPAPKSRQYASGQSSANLPHDYFSGPQSSAALKTPIVPHMMPQTHQKPNKPIPDAPITGKPHGDNPSHHSSVNCPAGMEKAWKIIDGTHQYIYIPSDGTKIDLGHHGKDEVAEDSEEARNLRRNPLLTPEEEKLREEVEKHGIGSTYKRPDHGDFEHGKELNGKVYFKATSGTKGYKPGLWVEDPNVQAKGLKDVPKTGIRPKFTGPQNLPSEPAKKAEPIRPGAVGLTGRTNTAQTNPQTGKVEMEQGRANVAQTGLTGGKAPTVDTSENRPAVAPPPPPPPPLRKPSTATANKPGAIASGPNPADTTQPATAAAGG